MRRRAFTLIEVLAVLAIIILVASLMYPVFAAAKARAKETVCTSQLRQIGMALSLYREDFGGPSTYGEMSEMGLPPTLKELITRGLLNRELVMCKGRKEGMEPVALYNVTWAPEGTIGVPSWKDYVQRFGDNSIVMTDENHDFADSPISDPYVLHHGIGLYLDGHVQARTKTGFWTDRIWWN